MSYKLLDLSGLSRFLNKLKDIIPTKTSELQNDSGFITQSDTVDSALSDTSEKAVQNKVIKQALDSKANDNSVVHTTGNESVSGTKSFNSDLNLNYSSIDVDDIVDSLPGTGSADTFVHLIGAETINGIKSFPDGIVANVSGTATPLAHTHTTSDITNLSIPSKVSDLTNDSGFITGVSWNDVSGKPSSFTPSSHSHGSITNDGKLGTAANKPLITGANGVISTGSFGTSANTFCQGNDSRLSDARTPLSHTHASNDITSLDASKLTGTIDIARLPKGALERLVTVADQTARFALTTNDVQLGDTVKQLDTGVMYIVSDESKLSSADGYTEYTAGSATSVPWSGVTGKPSSYTPASHTHGNIANGGTLGTASRALITDGNKKITTSSVTSTELGYVSGVTSAIQTQLDGKAASSHTHAASEVSGLSTVATSGSYNDLSNKPTIDSALSSTSTNAVQNKVINTALSGKAASSHTHTKSQITDFPTKTSQFTNDSHQTITVGTDTTSTASPAHSGTFTCIDSVTRDSNGHVTAVNTKTVTLPADNNTDTKVTNTLGTTTKAYVTGTTSATTNTGTQIFDTGVYLSTTAGELVATKFTGTLNGNANTATQFSANKDVTLTGDVTGTASSKAGWSVATTLSDSGVTAGTYGPSADVTGNNVTSVANRTLTCKNNTYNVYNKTLTIQKNGTNVATFTSNSNTDVTANITVPTKTSELTNDSGYLTSHQSLSNYVTLNGAQTISGAKTFTGNSAFTGNLVGTDITSQTLDINNCVSTTAGSCKVYYCTTSGGTNNFTNSPVAQAFIMYSRTPRYVSSSDYVYEQIAYGGQTIYFRTCVNGTWTGWKQFSTTDHTHSQYLTTHQSLANYSTLANTVKSLSISGKTITVTPGSGSAYTLTTQDTVYTHPTTSGNKHIPSGGSSGQFLGWDSDGTAKWVNNPNTNTDTLMTQNVSTTNATYPVLLVATADATANQGAKTGIFAKSVKVNPSTNTLYTSNLIYSGSLYQYKSGYTKGKAFTSNVFLGMAFKDSVGTVLADILYYQNTVANDGKAGIAFRVHGNANYSGTNTAQEPSLGVGVTKDNEVYTFAPTPATSDNSTQIATTAFVKAQGYLPLTGGTVTGDIICTTNFVRKHTSLVKGTNPSSKLYLGLKFCDKNGANTANNALGLVETSVGTDGTVSTYITAFKNTASNNSYASKVSCNYDTTKGWINCVGEELQLASGIRTQGTVPTSNQDCYFKMYDSASHVMFQILNRSVANSSANQTYTAISTAPNTSGAAVTDAFRIYAQTDNNSTVCNVLTQNFFPISNNTYALGDNSHRWKSIHVTHPGATDSSNLVATTAWVRARVKDIISGGGSTSAGGISPVEGTIISGLALSTSVTYSTAMGGIVTTPANLFYAVVTVNISTGVITYTKGSVVGGSGTWKIMGGCPTTQGNVNMYLFGIWVKVA